MAETLSIHTRHKEGVLELIKQFGEFGATADGGVNRLAASAEDKAARDFLIRWFEQNGYDTLIDPVGNIFGVLTLDDTLPENSFYCGSHLDSQPNGGRFDGTLGVVFACFAGLALKELIGHGKIENAYRNLVVACWTSEEGARFQPSLLGSRVFVGNMTKENAWGISDHHTVTLKNALSGTNYLGSDTPPKPDRYLEVHIEQGTKLEDAGLSVGIVSSAWGARKITLSIAGKPDHTGPTPMDERKDALLTASKIIVEVNDISGEADTQLHSSVGRLDVAPNSPNTVASKADLWVEFRAADDAVLDEAESKLQAATDRISELTGCGIHQTSREVRPVVKLDESTRTIVSEAFDRNNIGYLQLTTISGHDALQLQDICPSTLMFVPSHRGISHSPDEFTSDSDISDGFEATVAALAALASQSHSSDVGERLNA